MTGAGVNDFFEAVTEKAQEFDRDYKPELERRRKQREDEKVANREKELGKLMKDMAVSGVPMSKEAKAKAAASAKDDMDTLSDMEDDDTEDEEGGAEEDADDPEGLNARYKQALADSGGPASNDDHSFARYLRASQMNI